MRSETVTVCAFRRSSTYVRSGAVTVRAVATSFRVLYWWRQHCKQISNGRLEIFKKIITLLTVTVLSLFSFFNLILDAPRISLPSTYVGYCTDKEFWRMLMLQLSRTLLPHFYTWRFILPGSSDWETFAWCRLWLQTSMDKRGGKGLSEKCENTLHTLVREVQVR